MLYILVGDRAIRFFFYLNKKVHIMSMLEAIQSSAKKIAIEIARIVVILVLSALLGLGSAYLGLGLKVRFKDYVLNLEGHDSSTIHVTNKQGLDPDYWAVWIVVTREKEEYEVADPDVYSHIKSGVNEVDFYKPLFGKRKRITAVKGD